MDTLSNKRVSPEMKGQQSVRCITEDETKGFDMVRSIPSETRTRERLRWQGPAAYTKDRPVLSSERAPTRKQDRNCQTVINV
jgi:hypothetical protein